MTATTTNDFQPRILDALFLSLLTVEGDALVSCFLLYGYREEGKEGKEVSSRGV